MIKKLLLAIMIALPMSVFAQKFGVVNTNQLTSLQSSRKSSTRNIRNSRLLKNQPPRP